ncbi:MAG TPA: tetratricopeptide repeat protein, partial [Plasticicumulans sp.]|nr:tetratricopeptide repeat protein [Plasticicumulans sp.]
MPLQTDPASAAAEELLQQAEASRRAGDPALAAALYQRVLNLWPESPAARIAAGRLDTLGLP